MSLKIVRLLIIIISRKFKELLQNEIQIWWSRKNIKQNQDFLKENLIGRKMLKWDQDHDLLWKLANQDPIILSRHPHWSSNWRRLKISDNYEGSDSYKKLVFLLWRWYGQRSFRGSYRWEPKPTRSLTRLKQNEIREKQRSYYDAGIFAEVITKDFLD